MSLCSIDRNLFDLYSDSIKDFKVNYLGIIAMNTTVKRRVAEYENGDIIGEKFPLFWRRNHYSKTPSEYSLVSEQLDDEDRDFEVIGGVVGFGSQRTYKYEGLGYCRDRRGPSTSLLG